jgi:hypothetical protein
MEAGGWDQLRQPRATPRRSRWGVGADLVVAVAALLAAAGGGDQLQYFSILEHTGSMLLSLRKTNWFTSICSLRSRLTIYDHDRGNTIQM